MQASRCLKHLVLARERQRSKHGLKHRYMNTLSYRLEASLTAAPASGTRPATVNTTE